jgi:flagella basal body P-ring formation protein FlgA
MTTPNLPSMHDLSRSLYRGLYRKRPASIKASTKFATKVTAPAIIAVFGLYLSALLTLGAPALPLPEYSTPWQLRPSALVDSSGIFLDQLLTEAQAKSAPHLRLAAAPTPGQVANLTAAQVSAWVREQRADLGETNWAGAKVVRVMRRMRILEETELKQMLAATLQHGVVKDRGELELRFSRAWTPVHVPDELLNLNILDLPTAGVTPNCIVRFELRAGPELAGTWQWPVQAKVWREIWVARTVLNRGELVASADLARERRDVLTLREAPASFEPGNPSLEVAEHIMAGAPLGSRSVRLRPVVRRGKIVDAILQDGSLTITVKAEALEDGVPGQTVRARNLSSKREFRGKVQNEQELLVPL